MRGGAVRLCKKIYVQVIKVPFVVCALCVIVSSFIAIQLAQFNPFGHLTLPFERTYFPCLIYIRIISEGDLVWRQNSRNMSVLISRVTQMWTPMVKYRFFSPAVMFQHMVTAWVPHEKKKIMFEKSPASVSPNKALLIAIGEQIMRLSLSKVTNILFLAKPRAAIETSASRMRPAGRVFDTAAVQYACTVCMYSMPYSMHPLKMKFLSQCLFLCPCGTI